MHPEADDAAFLWDMLDAARSVSEFAADKTLDDYLRDRMMRRAIERELEIMGEAAGRVSAAFKDAHQEIPWRGIIGQRHVLAHGYGEVVHERVWDVVVHRVPVLREQLQRLLTPPPGES